MKQIELGYGHGLQSLTFDKERFHVLAPATSEIYPLADAEIGVAFDEPIESPGIEELFSAGDTVLIVVSDATRATASAQVVNLLVRRLIQAGVAAQDIGVIFATGIHRSVTMAEKKELLTPFVCQRLKTIDHDAHDATTMVQLGETKGGTPVEVNRALQDYSHVVVTGAIGFHYFAGFSGGRKSICPGLASARTIAATHMLAMDFATGGRRMGVGTGLLDGNAVNQECERVTELIDPVFGINTVVDERGRAVRIYAGHWRTSHRRGCANYLGSHSVEIPAKRDLVIASCGGFPWDINLIQAHKALEMAAQACAGGGTIILLAECADGLGRSDFLKWFAERDSAALAERLRDGYEVNGQTAWSLLTKTERYRVHLISTLSDEDVRRMRMTPAKSVAEVLADLGSSAPGYILPRGVTLLPIEKVAAVTDHRTAQ
jgi:nickel-dependent lactate racemase